MNAPLKKYPIAVRDALAHELRRDDTAFLMGEDVAAPGGIYGQTRGLLDEFGPKRVRDTPAGELGFMGAAVGAGWARGGWKLPPPPPPPPPAAQSPPAAPPRPAA